ncbi:serine/threonine-protein kinase [Streptomyces spiralis]
MREPGQHDADTETSDIRPRGALHAPDDHPPTVIAAPTPKTKSDDDHDRDLDGTPRDGIGEGARSYGHLTFPGGRYVLIRTLGAGGMASVHLAEDTQLSRRVAVKVAHPHLVARDANFRRRFEREAQLVARLSHDGVVRVHDTGVADWSGITVPFLVMEYVEGKTVAEMAYARQGAGGRPVEWTVRTVLALVEALDFSHRQGIVHRDVKPGNVMIGKDGGVKVMDFGIARSVLGEGTELTQTGALLGTPQYIAPELVSGKEPSSASDLYAVGVMLFELLAGRPPFEAESPANLLYRAVHEPAPDLGALCPDLDTRLVRLTTQLMSKQPGLRPTARRVSARLQAVLNGPAPSAPSAPSAPETSPAQRSRRTSSNPAWSRAGALRRRRRITWACTALAFALGAWLLLAVEGWPLGIRNVDAAAHPDGWRPWKHTLAYDEEGILLAGHVVYVAADGGIQAVDRTTGRVMWSHEESDGSWSGDTVTPYGNATRVYTASSTTVYAIDRADGTVVWRRKLLRTSVSGSLNIAGGQSGVYALTGDGIEALDLSEGRTRWTWHPPAGCTMTGGITVTRHVVFSRCESGEREVRLLAHRLSDGRTVWSRKLSDVFEPSTAINDNYVAYLGEDPSDPGTSVNDTVRVLDTRTGRELWHVTADTYTELAVSGKDVWALTKTGLDRYDAATGRTRADHAVDGQADGIAAVTPDLILLTGRGSVFAYDPRTGEQKWHYRAEPRQVLVARDVVYLAEDKAVVTVDARTGAGPCNAVYCPGQLW